MLTTERRVELSKIVKYYYDSVLEGCETEEETQHVCERLLTLLQESRIPSVDEGMSYVEAQKWYRNEQMPFGIHIHKKIIDVDPQYLLWLDDQPDFRRELHRFLASEYWRTTHGGS